MPNCEFCKLPCRIRRNEHPTLFEHRRFCSNNCTIKARRAGLIPGNPTVYSEMALRAKARNLARGCVSGTVLNPDKVRAIRELHSVLGFSAKEIAKLKGYKVVTVEAVLSGKSWSSVE